jgi:hypothetical protein
MCAEVVDTRSIHRVCMHDGPQRPLAELAICGVDSLAHAPATPAVRVVSLQLVPSPERTEVGS